MLRTARHDPQIKTLTDQTSQLAGPSPSQITKRSGTGEKSSSGGSPTLPAVASYTLIPENQTGIYPGMALLVAARVGTDSGTETCWKSQKGRDAR